jgi:6,7-dimethyl-8-ribityllumazine synthase
VTSAARYAIVVADYYGELAERLVAGARAAFADAGLDDVQLHTVPGALELPMAAQILAESGGFAGIACLGAVIRGETDHYTHVCEQTAAGIQRVQLTTGVPCGFGVLTCDTVTQALARSGGEKRHAGRSAAEAVVALAALRERLAGPLVRSELGDPPVLRAST